MGQHHLLTRRDAAIDGLRALAALSVVGFHVWLYSSPDPTRPTREGFSNRVFFEGRIGLVLFFVLSGFLLYRPFLRGVSLPSYFRRRAARILPAYYLALAGAVVLLWPVVPDLGLFLVFGQNYSGSTILKLNPVTWTLCVEMAFYVLLPVLALVKRRRAGLLAGLVGVGLAWNAAVHSAGAGQVAAKALPAFLPYFAVGMAVAAFGSRELSPRWARGLAVAGLLLVVGNGVWHSNAAPRAVNPLLAVLADLPAAAGFGLVIAAVASGGVSWLGARWLASVGVVSYGLYLWHVPLILFARRLDVAPVFAVPFALGAAVLSWRYVERPAMAAASRAPRPALVRHPAS